MHQHQNKDKIYETTTFKKMDIEPCRMVVSEGWEPNKVSPVIAQAYCLERVYRPWSRIGEPRWSLVDFLSWTEEAESSGDTTDRVHRSSTGKERATKKENPRGLQRVLISALHITTWGLGEKTAELIRWSSTSHSLRALNWAYSQTDWKTS